MTAPGGPSAGTAGRPSAVVLGDNCIDRYLPPDGRELVGGQAVNVAARLASRGVATAYAGVVGDDAPGRRVLDELRRRGVDTRLVEVARGSTGVTVIAVDGGERRFVSEDYGISAPYVPTPAALAQVATARLVYAAHVDDPAPVAAARAPGAWLAVDASEGDPDPRWLAAADIVFASSPGGDPAAGADLGRALVAAGPRLVVVTLGPGGAVAVGRHGLVVHAPPVGAVTGDTLGAGDALAAGFLAALLAGEAVGDALAAGARLAHEACGHVGALPPLDEG